MTGDPRLGAIYEVLTERPQGASAAEFAEILGQPVSSIESLLRQGLVNGTLEAWPFWPVRIRATEMAPLAYLQAIARLRRMAWPTQMEIGRLSGAPVTLHLLVREGHAVIERCPQDPDAEGVATELATYAKPRDLNSGATALALKAHMQELDNYQSPESVEIRQQGFCLREGVRILGSWILSAALTDERGTPYAALCTFAMSADISIARAQSCAAQMAQMTRALAGTAEAVIEPIATRACQHIRHYGQQR